MSLRHIVIPSWPHHTPPKFPTFVLASRVQAKIQRDLLDWKVAATLAAGAEPPYTPTPPLPTVISFTPEPTYTQGRRQVKAPNTVQSTRLRAPLHVTPPSAPSYLGDSTGGSSGNVFRPIIARTPRGGLTTYHGPGQVVLWPVVDLWSPSHPHFLVGGYISLLEATTAAVLRKVFGLNAFTDPEHRGVWVNGLNTDIPPPPPSTSSPGVPTGADQGGDGVRSESRSNKDEVAILRESELYSKEAYKRGEEPRKIAAVGVHLRRHITCFGTAVNLSVPVTGPEDINPWARFVPCGITGRRVTSVAAQLRDVGLPPPPPSPSSPSPLESEGFASAWAAEFADRLYNDATGGRRATADPRITVRTTVERVDWERWKQEENFDEDGDDTFGWEETERRSQLPSGR
ncbi:hypothetical protein GGS23DRAFT_180457 [Durotheca rogersii]|uniref:uncharacterized protein n=1 Tax=Durotheca rogersii TaxID=419775 RepID=UPI0022203241|nr:uncharacterized protein GGS23DRAFT_180457 [Durotheca rogersii]KAI5867497.1 hypothetical protein GGS23DRAFT_180457 [Durotheca rogersii]